MGGVSQNWSYLFCQLCTNRKLLFNITEESVDVTTERALAKHHTLFQNVSYQGVNFSSSLPLPPAITRWAHMHLSASCCDTGTLPVGQKASRRPKFASLFSGACVALISSSLPHLSPQPSRDVWLLQASCSRPAGARAVR